MKELKYKKIYEVKTVEIIINTPQIIHVQKQKQGLPLHNNWTMHMSNRIIRNKGKITPDQKRFF